LRIFFPYATAMMLISELAFFGSARSVAQESAESLVRRLNNEEVQAFLKKDPSALTQLWSDDLVITNPLNRLVTKTQVLEMIKSGFLVITSYNRTIEYLRIVGDVAIVAGNETVTWGGTMPLAGKIEHLRFTAMWMKQSGHWREEVRHANIVPPQ
jgi:ketosteroid isomerase-like protein